MSARPGMPAAASGKFAQAVGDVVICVDPAADVTHALADIQAAIVADGAAFPDGTAYDPANPEHVLYFLEVTSYPCGSDPCKDGNLVTVDTACVIEASGETKALHQGGTEEFDGSDNDSSAGVNAGGTVSIPSGSAVQYCYKIADRSQPIK